MHERYFLGLPAWAFPGWKDRYFTDRPSRLSSYATVFNAVEGNTTFYRTPDTATVLRWRDALGERPFRFCFKLPREVTHEFRPDLDALARFITAIEPLADRRGPLLVQFPATVGPDEIGRFEPVFDAAGETGHFVIEVRHPAFFDEPARLAPVLERHAAGRVVLDSRPIFLGDSGHPDVLSARHEKPDVPVIDTVYNGVCFVRLILHPAVDSNAAYIEDWAGRVARLLKRGVTVYMMIHCPNNQHCPELAWRFHRALRRREGMEAIAELPPWPVPLQGNLLVD